MPITGSWPKCAVTVMADTTPLTVRGLPAVVGKPPVPVQLMNAKPGLGTAVTWEQAPPENSVWEGVPVSDPPVPGRKSTVKAGAKPAVRVRSAVTAETVSGLAAEGLKPAPVQPVQPKPVAGRAVTGVQEPP